MNLQLYREVYVIIMELKYPSSGFADANYIQNMYVCTYCLTWLKLNYSPILYSKICAPDSYEYIQT